MADMIFLIRMKWNHLKFQMSCHCSLESGGHYVHVVSSDWESNDHEANIVEFLLMPFLRPKQHKWHHFHIISMSQTASSDLHAPSKTCRKWGYSLLADLLGATLKGISKLKPFFLDIGGLLEVTVVSFWMPRFGSLLPLHSSEPRCSRVAIHWKLGRCRRIGWVVHTSPCSLWVLTENRIE